MKINIEKIEEHRASENMSKARYSRSYGWSESTYRRILSCQSTTLKTLEKIAQRLNVDPKDLLI